MRAKPFSSALKKKQLQEKREKKRKTKSTEWAWDESSSSRDPKQPPPSSSGRGGGRSLVSQFQRLTTEELDERKKDAQIPIVPLTESEKRVSSRDIYPQDGIIQIPRRPAWNYDTTKEQLEDQERRYFDQWLSTIESNYSKEDLSYFERNLEVWRQLWRTVEMSDILLVITDARFPVLHFPPSLYQYVTEIVKKPMIVVMNKVDLVPKEVATEWWNYMHKEFPDLHIVQVSSYSEEQIQEKEKDGKQRSKRRVRPNYASSKGIDLILKRCKDITEKILNRQNINWDAIIEERTKSSDPQDDEDGENSSDSSEEDDDDTPAQALADDEEELDFFEAQRQEKKKRQKFVTLGMIGHPNVGKSTIVNALIGRKTVSVSKTPGHTKHFQTVFLSQDIRLCDCPGLVFPSKVPKPLQVICGVFNVAQVQEPYSSIQYLAERIDLPKILDLKFPVEESQNAAEKWSTYDICQAFALKRGFLTSKAGRPDVYRAANFILRMVIDGRFLPFYLRPKPDKE